MHVIRTLTSSIFPHSPFLKVIRTWLLVGRNSKPSSSHGTSNFPVPGFPRDEDFSSTVADICKEEHRGWLEKVKADDDTQRAAESGNHFIVTTRDETSEMKFNWVMCRIMRVIHVSLFLYSISHTLHSYPTLYSTATS
jgi:hypothetical protein